MKEYIEKAYVLIEALPYFNQFNGKTFVIKYGGSIMTDEKLKKNLFEDISLLKLVGINPVIVHGGGPAINEMLKKLQVKSKFVNGLRVTDQKTMEVVEMVLGASINKEIVAMINQLRGKAVGICGKDGGLIKATKKRFPDNDIDLGFVGEVVSIDPTIVENLIANDYIPVIAPIGCDDEGNTYNINADTVAGKLAIALKAEKLIYLTDVDGIRLNPEDENSRASVLSFSEIKDLIEKGKIQGGMLPKVESCIEAVSQGVVRTHILSGLLPHPLLLEIFTDQGIGTMIVND